MQGNTPVSLRLTSLTTGITQQKQVTAGPKGSETWVEHVAATFRQSFVVAGWYAPAGQSEGPSRTNFLSEVSLTGKLIRTFHLGDFAPHRVCVSENSLWILGQVPSNELVAGDYELLRHYSLDGSLLGSFLPRAEYVGKSLFNLDTSGQLFGKHLNVAQLSCSPQTAAVYLGPSQQFIEVSNDGKVTGWKAANIPSQRMARLILSQGMAVYADFMVGDSPPLVNAAFALKLGTDGAARFVNIQPDPSLALLGQDDNSLVYVSNFAEGQTAKASLHWYRP